MYMIITIVMVLTNVVILKYLCKRSTKFHNNFICDLTQKKKRL